MKDEVYAALHELYRPNGPLAVPPQELVDHFTELELAKIANDELHSSEAFNLGKAVIVAAGPPGAGKSSALKGLPLDGYRQIDPDKIKDRLLDQAEHSGLLEYRKELLLPDRHGHVHQRELASHVHRCSTVIADLIRMTALSRGENVVVDGSLSWSPLVERYIDELLEAGYETATIISVETPEDVAVQRARDRWWEERVLGEPGGRFIPEEVVRASFTEGRSSCTTNALTLYEKAQDELGSGKLIRYRFDPSTDRTIKITD